MARPQPVQEKPAVKPPNAARSKALQEGREKTMLRILARKALLKESRTERRSAFNAKLKDAKAVVEKHASEVKTAKTTPARGAANG